MRRPKSPNSRSTEHLALFLVFSIQITTFTPSSVGFTNRGTIKDELLSIKDQSQCNKCKPFIEYLNGQLREVKDKYERMKADRERLTTNIKQQAIEICDLKLKHLNLKFQLSKGKLRVLDRLDAEPCSPRFSEESLHSGLNCEHSRAIQSQITMPSGKYFYK